MVESKPVEWVLLTHRLPREPSTPRSSVWRTLHRLGVAQLAGGLVGLPADARTRDQLEWVAEEVREAHGSAGVWLARPASPAQQRELVATMAAARAAEYTAVHAQAVAAAGTPLTERRRVVRSVRTNLRQVRRRDFFPPAERDAAVAEVQELAATVAEADRSPTSSTATPGMRPAPICGGDDR